MIFSLRFLFQLSEVDICLRSPSDDFRLAHRTTQQLVLYKSKCFNTYKNNKKDDTHTHAHTHTHYQDKGVLYMMNPTETEDMWSLLWRLGGFTLSLSAPVSDPGGGVFLWRCALVGRGNSLHIRQAAHSQSVYDIRLCVSLFKPVGAPAQVYAAAISPSRQCRVVCTTARPDSLLRNTETVRQTHHGQ